MLSNLLNKQNNKLRVVPKQERKINYEKEKYYYISVLLFLIVCK